MIKELNIKLDTLLDDLERCNSSIIETKDSIKTIGYTDSLVESLVSFSVLKQKILFNIKDTQNGLNILHKSVS